MSCLGGICASGESRQGRQRDRQINRELKKYRKKFENELKLLLLGAGESGKSTIVKQMRIIHSTGFSTKEREQMRRPIYGNIANSIRAMVEFMDRSSIPLSDPELAKNVEWVRNTVREDDPSTYETEEFFNTVRKLWADTGVQECYRRSNEYQLNDSAKYFFDAIDRISNKDYLPTDQDMLQARIVTTGIFETKFVINTVVFHMFDVGGQRSERRKWIQCFSDVTGIIFTVATSAYNQCLREDSNQNRLVEALDLFDQIWRNRWLAKVSVVLLLNKCDILQEKIQSFEMSVYFEDYTGGANFEKAKQYIKNRFVAIGQPSDHKRLYPHFSVATDTENIRKVFNDVKDIILHFHLAEFGLV